MSTAHKGVVERSTVTRFTVERSEEVVNVINQTTIVVTSGTFVNVTEQTGELQDVYTVTARDPDGVTTGFTFTLSNTGDSSQFSINSTTGVITLTPNPDFEITPSYSITVNAEKSGFTTGSKTVTVNVVNVDEVAPAITSGAVGNTLVENSGAGQVIYTITATDSVDYISSSDDLTFGITGGDSGLLQVDSASGVVTLTANPDYENKNSYSFTAQATDASGNVGTQAVTASITNVVDVDPTWINSTVTAGAVVEANTTPAAVAIYDLDTNLNNPDNVAVAYNIVNVNTGFVGFYIDANNVVRTTNALDYETATSHDLAIVVTYTNIAGTTSSNGFTLTVPVSDLNDNAPVFTSATSGRVYYELAGQVSPVVYTATVSDADTVGTITFSLGGTDAGSFTINSQTGVVNMNTGTSQTSKTSLDFTVTASDGTNSVTTGTLTAEVANDYVTAGLGTSGQIAAVTSGTLSEITENANSLGEVGKMTIFGIPNILQNNIGPADSYADGIQTRKWTVARGSSNNGQLLTGSRPIVRGQFTNSSAATTSRYGVFYKATRGINDPLDLTYSSGARFHVELAKFDTAQQLFGNIETSTNAVNAVTASGQTSEDSFTPNTSSNVSERNKIRFKHSTDTAGIAAMGSSIPTGTMVVMQGVGSSQSVPPHDGSTYQNSMMMGDVYYVINNGDGSIRLAWTYSDAINNNYVEFTGYGAGMMNQAQYRFCPVIDTVPHYLDIKPSLAISSSSSVSYTPDDLNPTYTADSIIHTVTATGGSRKATDDADNDEGFFDGLIHGVQFGRHTTGGHFSSGQFYSQYLNIYTGEIALPAGTYGTATPTIKVFDIGGGFVTQNLSIGQDGPAIFGTNIHYITYDSTTLSSPTQVIGGPGLSAPGATGHAYSITSVGSDYGASLPTINSSTGAITFPAGTTATGDNAEINVRLSASTGNLDYTLPVYDESVAQDLSANWHFIPNARAIINTSTSSGVPDAGFTEDVFAQVGGSSTDYSQLNDNYIGAYDTRDVHYDIGSAGGSANRTLYIMGKITATTWYENDIAIAGIQILRTNGDVMANLSPYVTMRAHTGSPFTSLPAVSTGLSNYSTASMLRGTGSDGVQNNTARWHVFRSAVGTGSTNTGVRYGIDFTNVVKEALPYNHTATGIDTPSPLLRQQEGRYVWYLEASAMAQGEMQFMRSNTLSNVPNQGIIRIAFAIPTAAGNSGSINPADSIALAMV